MTRPLSVSLPRSGSASAKLALLFALSCAVFLNGCKANSAGLALPFDGSGDIEAPNGYTHCDQDPVAPVKDLVLGPVYKRSDPTRSEVDEDAQKEYRAQIGSLNSFENRLSALANNYIKDRNDTRSAACALEWLHQWAGAGALLGEMNVQGLYARQWSLASIASSYLQVRYYPNFPDDKKDTIERWLAALAHNVIADYDDMESAARKQNNHLYWAAWAAMAAALATDKREFYAWSVAKVKYALHAQAQEDGTLPLETARGKKALQYHVFALAPLVMVAETAMRNGEDLYSLNDGMLHKMVRRAFEGLNDPAYFEQISGYQQMPPTDFSSGHYSWLEVYNARFPDAEIEAFLKKHRPIVSRRTGGDMTFLYGG